MLNDSRASISLYLIKDGKRFNRNEGLEVLNMEGVDWIWCRLGVVVKYNYLNIGLKLCRL